MRPYQVQAARRQPSTGKIIARIIAVLMVLVVLAAGAALAVRQTYHNNLKPLSNSSTTKLVAVKSGSTTAQIAKLLKDQDLIRTSWAFEWYMRNQESTAPLQAGTYSIRPNQSVPQIVATMTGGKVAVNLVTILPGQRIDQIRDGLIQSGFSATDVDAALNPSLYTDMPILAFKPADANSLEGLLYPDSFQKTADTSAKEIVRQSLALMYQQLTPQIRDAITKRGLTVYQGIVLASIVNQEVGGAEDRRTVAQVFYLRMAKDISLGSDVTNFYGARLKGVAASATLDSPYNTHTNKGLPPTPISNVDASALQAVANPTGTDWLFFVAGDDGKTYFAHTVDEHDANVAKYCTKLCQ